jgi:hypothetical protein
MEGNMTTTEKIENVLATVDGYDLQHYAARAALSELAENWRAALNEGADLSELVPDIDLVVSILLGCKRQLKHND